MTAAWQHATALLLARDVHSPRPTLAARAFAHVTAVERDATRFFAWPLSEGNVTGTLDQVTAWPHSVHLGIKQPLIAWGHGHRQTQEVEATSLSSLPLF